MIGYIISGVIILYYVTFCSMFVHVLCKEKYKRRRDLLRTYDTIDEVNIEINSSDVSSKLSTIYEV
jgi:hypothetical protein